MNVTPQTTQNNVCTERDGRAGNLGQNMDLEAVTAQVMAAMRAEMQTMLRTMVGCQNPNRTALRQQGGNDGCRLLDRNSARLVFDKANGQNGTGEENNDKHDNEGKSKTALIGLVRAYILKLPVRTKDAIVLEMSRCQIDKEMDVDHFMG